LPCRPAAGAVQLAAYPKGWVDHRRSVVYSFGKLRKIADQDRRLRG
jgi:hypothetical protein